MSNQLDCNTCHHFTKADFNETEGYCTIDKRWCHPYAGIGCEHHENKSLYTAQFCPYFPENCTCQEEHEVCDFSKDYPEQMTLLRQEDFDFWVDVMFKMTQERITQMYECLHNLYRDRCDKLENQHATTCADMEEHEYRISVLEEKVKRIMDYIASKEIKHIGKDFCGNCFYHLSPKHENEVPVCGLSDLVVNPDDASCAMYQDSYVDTDSASNQLDKELMGKPDREECKHCPKSQCDNCMNFPF